jgi:hypothetical protein
MARDITHATLCQTGSTAKNHGSVVDGAHIFCYLVAVPRVSTSRGMNIYDMQLTSVLYYYTHFIHCFTYRIVFFTCYMDDSIYSEGFGTYTKRTQCTLLSRY